MDKDYLKKYQRMNIELIRIENKISELRYRIEKPKSSIISNIPHSNEHIDFTDLIDKLLELQNYYDKRAKEIIAEQIIIENTISELADPVERAIMEYRYIDGYKWEIILMKLNYDYENKETFSWAKMHRLHAEALIHIENL